MGYFVVLERSLTFAPFNFDRRGRVTPLPRVPRLSHLPTSSGDNLQQFEGAEKATTLCPCFPGRRRCDTKSALKRLRG